MSELKLVGRLRFIDRGGKRIIQQQELIIHTHDFNHTAKPDLVITKIEAGEWHDVPMIVSGVGEVG